MLGLNKHSRILKLVDLVAIKWFYRTVGDYRPDKWYQFIAFIEQSTQRPLN